MGSTSFAHLRRDTISLLKKELADENSFGKWEWLDHAERGSTVYVLIRKTPKVPEDRCPYIADDEGSYKYILVVLSERHGEHFTYKDISETAGPVEKDCPERLLNSASPFKDGQGAFGPKWRADCRARRKEVNRQKASNPKPGDTFRTLKPITFRDGTSHSEFTCRQVRHKGRNAIVYAAKDTGALYRFRPATFGFEILSTQTKTKKAGG